MVWSWYGIMVLWYGILEFNGQQHLRVLDKKDNIGLCVCRVE